MVRQEWRTLFRNKILLLVVVAVIAIPSIYTTLFLGSMWDPYGKVENLPVAVVNEDRPASYGDTQLRIGEELEEKLKADGSLDFRFTDEKTARRWLADGECYMVITIPEDFSANAASLTEEEPQKMELQYETNPGTNYIASKMSESAMKEIKSSVREEVTKVYAGAVLAGIRQAGEGMEEAASGAGQLGAGTGEALHGSESISQNLGVLAESARALRDGSRELESGVETYTGAVQAAGDGIGQVDDGAGALADASGQILQGAEELQSGADGLQGGLQAIAGENGATSRALSDGSRQLADGMAAFAGAVQQIPDLSGLTAWGQQLEDAAAVLGSLPAGTDPSGLASQIEAAQQAGDPQELGALAQEALAEAQVNYQTLQAVNSQAGQVSGVLSQAGETLSGASGMLSGVGELASQAETLKEKSAALADGVQAYTAGVDQAAEGSRALRSGLNTLAASLDQADGGIRSLKQGTDALRDGAAQLGAAAPSLTDGAGQVTDGTGQLADGAGRLETGSLELGAGLSKVKDGADRLAESLSDGARSAADTRTGEKTADMFAAPVDTREEQMTDMPDNGHAMAPYMMSVGLWVGCIAFSLMYPLNSYSGKLRSGKAWWRSKATVLYTVAILQALVMLGALHVFDGFAPVRWGQTVLTACVASAAFMSVMYFFTDLLGKAGSFLMLVFMVVQLAGAVGTYPLEVSGDFVPALHGWVPFTYTVQAFRSAISGGEEIGGCLVFLLGLALVFTLLTIGVFRVRAYRIRRGQPLLMDWLEGHGLA